MKTKFGLILIAVLTVLTLTLAVGHTSEAETTKVIKWTGQYWAPSTMPYGPFGENYAGLNAMYKLWSQWLEDATGGRLQIKWVEAGSVFPVTAADLEIGKGTLPIAASSGLYYRGRFPEGDIESGGVFFWKSESEAYEAYYKYGLWEALNELYAKRNLVYFPIHGDSLNGIGVTFDASSIDSIRGKKIRAVGVQGDYIALLGGSPVAIPLGETYMALKLGTADGWVAATGLLEALKYKEVTKGFVIEPKPSSTAVNIIINKDAFESLPKDIQDTLMKESRYAGLAAATTWRNQCNWALEQAQRSYGLKVYNWSQEDQAKARKLVIDKLWPKMAKASPGSAKLMEIIYKQARDYGRIP
jgi:TRAP-type mannitol/chloroaromatic compound transport system substrate-binding protein